jgi:D-alanyl-D-alanine dipeptidase
VVTNNVLYLPIADQAIKNIEVQDSQEDLVDLLAVNNARMRPLYTLNPAFMPNHQEYSKVRRGLYEKLLIMLDALPKEIGIAYFEGLRPLAIQKQYFDKKLKETLLTIKDKQQAYQETAKLVSPFINNIPVHCTGAAIDIMLFRIVDNSYELLDMGQFGVISGENKQQENFSKNINAQQRTNRLTLLKAATQAGLVNYGYEWWHYSFGDKAWAYVKGKKHAIYGLAVQKDDPILSINQDAYLAQF